MKFAPKFTQKSVFIMLASIGVLCFALVVGIFLGEYSYNSGIFKRIEEVVQQLGTEEDTEEEGTGETRVEVNGASFVGDFKDSVICQGNTYDLTITTTNALNEVQTPVSLFIDTDKAKHIYDFDQRATHYEAGQVTGTLNGKKIPDGTSYYIGVYESYSFGARSEWDKTIIRYFVLDSKIYILTGDFYNDGESVDVFVTGEVYDEENGLQDSGTLATNVVVLDSVNAGEDNCFNSSAYLQKIDSTQDASSYSYIITDQEVVFEIYKDEYKRLSDVIGYTEIDSYNGLKLLRNTSGKVVLEDREGLLMRAEMELSWFGKGTEFVISFKDGNTSTSPYISEYGNCEVNQEGSYNYVYEDVEKQNSEYIGVAYGSAVYQKNDIATDSFTKKLYEEDYVGGEFWKYNTLTIDDSGALSFDEYLTYHPVIYIADPYGFYIRLTNSEFYASGGCAKPAIYLYPEETTDVSVKVIPNGRLVFTSPKYNNGWDIQVTSLGDITNLVDGRLYKYLWWDSVSYEFKKPEGGFVVSKTNVSNFLTKKLAEMNLNDNEISDFKGYWVPKLTNLDTDYIYISFLFNDEVNQIAELKVSPIPDNVFRVFMVYKPISKDTIVVPLSIESARRQGFTLVEWGGAEI